MSVSSGSDITIPIQDSPPPPPSPYAGSGSGKAQGSKGNSSDANKPTSTDNVTIIDTTGVALNDTGKETPEPRGDVTVTVGFVNEAYQDHSPDHEKKQSNGKGNGAISISVAGAGGNEKSNGGVQNGDTTMELHLNEAVNPELINMNILNTIPDKPNPEYGPYDNMDEYFVPVNQHKKFLRRSEKLYVTKDKRKETRWKKYVCWLIGASILATIVTVAVLAGIGLIPQKSSEFNTESVVGSKPSSSSEFEDFFSSSTSPENSLPSSTEINTPPTVPADATYVPMAADINFHITDLSYEPALNDKNSERFQTLSTEIQDNIKSVLKNRAGLENVNSRVIEFAPGSVFVKMRIGWVDQSMDFQKLKFMLSNVTSVGSYDVMSVLAYEVVNHCKFNNNGCSHNCSYDYASMDFYCGCMDDTYYLDEDKKTCRSMYEVTSSSTTTTTTTSEPFVPDLMTSSEEIQPSSSPTSVETEHHDHSHDAIVPSEEATSEEIYPTSQPEDEHDHYHHHNQEESLKPSPVPESEEETATQYNNNFGSSEASEPVSHEHHVPQEEMIRVGSSSTTAAPASSEEPVSEEKFDHEQHHDLGLPIAVSESTTTSTSSTTEGPVVGLSSEEEVISEHTEQPRQTNLEDESEHETTSLPILPVSSEESVGSNDEWPKRSSEEASKLGRTETLNEEDRSTEPTPELQSQETPELASSAENATLTELVRNTSDEHDHNAPLVLPETRNETIDEAIETTMAPVVASEEAQLVDSEKHSFDPVTSEEVTTIPSILAEEMSEVTTVLPGQEEEENQSHHISPMDVLNFSSAEKSKNDTATVSAPIEPLGTFTSGENHEQPSGRSISGENQSVLPESSSSSSVENVENVSQASPNQFESLTEDESVTESSRQMGSDEGLREPRLYSDEMTNSMQFLGINDDFKKKENREREELAPAIDLDEEDTRRNVTDSASVELETADENPGMASAVTSTSSEDAASRENVTTGTGLSDSVESQSGSNEASVSEKVVDATSVSSSSELSQESPLQSFVESENDSGERATTYTPLSLIHDIDVNYVGNRTSDHINSEQVPTEVGSSDVEHVDGLNEAVQTDKEKLIVDPADDMEEMMEATTTMIIPTVLENKNSQQSVEQEAENPATTSPESVPVPESQENTPVLQSPDSQTSAEKHDEQEQPVVVSPPSISEVDQSNSGSLENSGATRSITSPIDVIVGSEESIESGNNRDHRDTDEDLSSPSSYSGSSSRSVESGERSDEFTRIIAEMTTVPSEPEVSPVFTTSTTTTSTTTTSTTAVPETTTLPPQTSAHETTTAAVTTTTVVTDASSTIVPIPIQETISNTNTSISSNSNLNAKSSSENLEVGSLSMEGFNSHHIDNIHGISSPEEEQTSHSSSNEGGDSHFPSGSGASTSSVGDNSSDDLNNNELA